MNVGIRVSVLQLLGMAAGIHCVQRGIACSLLACVVYGMTLTVFAAPTNWTDLQLDQSGYPNGGCYDYTLSGTIYPDEGGRVYVQGLLYGHEEAGAFYLKSYDYSGTAAPVQCTWVLTFLGGVLGEHSFQAAVPIDLTWYGYENEGGTLIPDRGDFYLGFCAEKAWMESDEAWYGWVHVSVDAEFHMSLLDTGISQGLSPVTVGAIPEPASGILSLLAVAMLGLRRPGGRNRR